MYAGGINSFAAPHNIAPGGASGIAILINYLFDIPIGLFVLIFNIPLLLITWRSTVLPRSFTARSTVAIVLLSLITDLMDIILPVYKGDPLLASLLAGALMGTGMGLAHLGHSNTGGISLLGLLLQMKRPLVKTGTVLFILNSTVILASALVYKNIENLLYAVVTVYVSGLFMDKIIDSATTRALMLIISDCTDKVRRALLDNGRSITIIKGEGGYSGDRQRIILCAIDKASANKMQKLVRLTDPAALIIMNAANTIEGKGFRHVI